MHVEDIKQNIKIKWYKEIESLPQTPAQTLKFQTMNYVRFKKLSWRYPKFIIPLGCKDTGIRTIQFVTKTQYKLYPQ